MGETDGKGGHLPRLAGRLLDKSFPSRSPAVTASANVLVKNRHALREWDVGANGWQAIEGAPCVLINNRRAHRIQDAHSASNLCTACCDVEYGNFETTAASHPSVFVIAFEIRKGKKGFSGSKDVEIPIAHPEPLRDVKYRIIDVRGKELLNGTTDKNGRTALVVESSATRVRLDMWLAAANRWEPLETVDLIATQQNQCTAEHFQKHIRIAKLYDYVIPVFLVHLLLPTRHEHVGALSIRAGNISATELWGEDFRQYFKPNNSAAQNIQWCHWRIRAPTPQEGDITPNRVRRAPLRKLLHGAGNEILKNAPCLNRQGGEEYEIQNGTILRITTINEKGEPYALRGKSEKEAVSFGRVPILAFNDTEADGVRIHSGREDRHSQKVDLSSAHLVRDKDGNWTDLYLTHGCIRVSELWMREIVSVLAPIANFYLDANGKYQQQQDVPEPGAIGFCVAEQHPDPNWCAVANERVTYGVTKRDGTTESRTSSACVSVSHDAGWSSTVFASVIKESR